MHDQFHKVSLSFWPLECDDKNLRTMWFYFVPNSAYFIINYKLNPILNHFMLNGDLHQLQEASIYCKHDELDSCFFFLV